MADTILPNSPAPSWTSLMQGAKYGPVTCESYGASVLATAAENTAAIQEALDQTGLVTLTTPGAYAVTADAFTVGSNTLFQQGPGVTFTVSGSPTTLTSLQSYQAGPTTFSTIRMLPISTSLFQMGTSTQTAAGEQFNFTTLRTNSAQYVRPVDIYLESGINPGSAGAGAADFHLIDAKMYGGASNTNITASTRMYCIENQVQYTGNAGRTLGQGVATYNLARISGAGTATELVASQNLVANTGTGTTTTGIGVQIKSATNSGGGTVTTNIGLNVENQTVGTTNYAIKTGTGQVSFFSGTAVPAGGTAGVGIQMSSTANLGVFFGSGAPSLSAAQGSLYLRTDGSSTSTRMYVNTNGTTGWTAVTTAT